MRKPTKKEAQTIEIDVNKTGFTVWMTLDRKAGRRKYKDRRWILDGSMVKKDFEIVLGNPDVWPVKAKVTDADYPHYGGQKITIRVDPKEINR